MIPRTLAVIAGSGMGGIADRVETRRVVRFADIEGVGACTVDGHAGEVRVGAVGGCACLLVLGRRHGYEGEAHAVEHLVAWLVDAGATDLVVTSAAGALNPGLVPGDLVVVQDFLDRQNRIPRPGTPLMKPRVDAALTRRVERAATGAGVSWHRGTVMCGAGPAYETHAEVLAFQDAGADVATMSSAPEVIAAGRRGLAVAVVAVVTNPCTGIAHAAPSHRDVLDVGRKAAAGLGQIIVQLAMNM